jgi:hypothetical protein
MHFIEGLVFSQTQRANEDEHIQTEGEAGQGQGVCCRTSVHCCVSRAGLIWATVAPMDQIQNFV